jgi:hypothetical protein
MMYWLTEDAVLNCPHQSGIVDIVASQSLVTVDARRVLVESDPENRPIKSCPWSGPGLAKCSKTEAVKEGYSPLISIDGLRVCLDTVTGLTTSIPPKTFSYTVRHAGQDLVSQL